MMGHQDRNPNSTLEAGTEVSSLGFLTQSRPTCPGTAYSGLGSSTSISNQEINPTDMCTGWSDGGSSSPDVPFSLVCQVDKQDQPSQSSNLHLFDKYQLCLSHNFHPTAILTFMLISQRPFHFFEYKDRINPVYY